MIRAIIISYNRPEDLLSALQDFAKMDDLNLLKEIIVLNNQSTINYSVVENFISNNPQVPFKYILSAENLGVSRGRNYATQFATGNIFVYLDDDINIADKKILQKINQSFLHKEVDERRLGAVSFKVLYSINNEMQKTAFPQKNFNKYKDQNTFQTYYFAGCAHAITKEAWKETGNYPEGFFYGMEEYDFSYRLLDKNYFIRYDSSVVIFHKESPFGRTSKPEKLKMMWVNKTKIAWWYLPKKYFYSTAFLWSFEFLLKTKFDIRKYLEGWRQITKIPRIEKRKSIKKTTLEYLKKVEARLWY